MSSAPTPRSQRLVPVLILVVAVILVTVSIVLAGRGDDPQAEATDSPLVVEHPDQPTTIDMARLEEGDPLAAGPVDAPVTLVLYSDYQCPFCASWSAETGPVMLEYAEAGALRIEYRDIAVFGPESERAALAAYAAGLQGQYLEYQAVLFESGEFTPEALIATAEVVGLDVDQFISDLGSAEVAAAVQRNVDEAAAIGAFSTPAFLLAGQPILGAQPTDVFVGALEQALAESRE